VRRYLEDADIAAEIRAADRMFNWFPRAVNLLNWPSMLLSGVFRPAVSEYWMRWMTPFSPFLAKEWVARIAPAQSLVPTRPEEWFHEVAETFNRSDIGIMFNVFEPKSGIGYLHTNKAGLKLLDKKEGEWDHGRVRYAPITAKAVKDALWLYLYGFEGQELLDGAYHRQIILRELHPFDRIYAVRPQNQRWIGALPRTGFELRDLEIELWFNSSYAAECAGIELVNDLLKAEQTDIAAALRKNDKHPISLVEVEIGEQSGFDDYFVESLEVFEKAYTSALAALEQHESRKTEEPMPVAA
jgi:hypothetical protein